MGGKQTRHIFEMMVGGYVIYLGMKTITEAMRDQASGLNKIIMACTALMIAGLIVVIYGLRAYIKTKNEPDEEELDLNSEDGDGVADDEVSEVVVPERKKSMKDIANLSAFSSDEEEE